VEITSFGSYYNILGVMLHSSNDIMTTLSRDRFNLYFIFFEKKNEVNPVTNLTSGNSEKNFENFEKFGKLKKSLNLANVKS
jgi:hypothetical protein